MIGPLVVVAVFWAAVIVIAVIVAPMNRRYDERPRHLQHHCAKQP